MKKIVSIIVSLSLIFGGISLASEEPQEHSYPFSVLELPVLQDIYQLDLMIKRLPYIVANNASLFALPYYHWSAAQEFAYEINNETIAAFLSGSQWFEDFYKKVRITIMRSLIDQGYMNFNNEPYQEGNLAINIQTWDFHVIRDISENDTLDVILHGILSGFATDFENIKTYGDYMDFKSIGITLEEYSQLWTLFLFKNEQDLRDLWYELISWKIRENVDKEYRRYNIMTAFKNIGNVRLIMPNETFNLTDEIRYTPYNGNSMYVSGYATIWAGVRWVYGGGLCGVSTAIYQGMLTNRGFQLLQYIPHSTYYRDLFNAEINGIRVSTPGLDATIYAPRYNLQYKNIRDYPIILVLNFRWGESDPEQVFTLSKAQDKWTFEFVWRRGMCYTWKINEENRTSCYNYIKDF